MNHRDKLRSKSLAFILASASTQNSEPSDKAKKDKKKKKHKDKRDSRKPRDSSTLAVGVNKAEIGDNRKKDISEITCYNFNKRDTMQQSIQSLGSQKTSIGLGDLYVNDWY